VTAQAKASKPAVSTASASRRAELVAVDDSRHGVSVVETVVEAIRNEIKTGRLAPGQRLIESEIRAAIGASRASIREAMGRLEAEGLVEIEHQKGARVRRLTAAEAANIYDVREALEGVAARLAAQNVDKADYKSRLRALERKYSAESDGMPGTYLRYNESFHHLIVEMSENWRLIRMVEQLQHPAFLMLIQVISNRQAVVRASREHLPIVKAILDGDGARAERAMRVHIRRTGRDIIARIVEFLK
jgi:DNA-binding GntR family transcriptional regulator